MKEQEEQYKIVSLVPEQMPKKGWAVVRVEHDQDGEMNHVKGIFPTRKLATMFVALFRE